jgi:squalene cyclase
MAITLNLPPEVEATLAARARALGVELDAYVQTLLQQQAASSPLRAVGDAAKEVERQMSELSWLETHREQFAGRWVALEGNALLAVGDSAREVYAAIARHEGAPLVTRIEPEEQLPFAGW